MPLELRVKYTKQVKGKKNLITTAKTTAKGELQEGIEEDRTIKRTIEGEKAALQIKWIRNKSKLDVVHLHCQKDKNASEWSRTTGIPINKLYELKNYDSAFPNSFIVKCRLCNREWSSGGSTWEIKQLDQPLSSIQI